MIPAVANGRLKEAKGGSTAASESQFVVAQFDSHLKKVCEICDTSATRAKASQPADVPVLPVQ